MLLAIGVDRGAGAVGGDRHPGARRWSTSRARRAWCAPSVLVVRELDYVQAARRRRRHGHRRILHASTSCPTAMAPLIVQLSASCSRMPMLSEAVLSFLGVGARAARAELGRT
jgi:ABC-type dipeptide/oligopeptide/nickel transport system permease subunit